MPTQWQLAKATSSRRNGTCPSNFKVLDLTQPRPAPRMCSYYFIVSAAEFFRSVIDVRDGSRLAPERAVMQSEIPFRLLLNVLWNLGNAEFFYTNITATNFTACMIATKVNGTWPIRSRQQLSRSDTTIKKTVLNCQVPAASSSQENKPAAHGQTITVILKKKITSLRIILQCHETRTLKWTRLMR